VETKNKGEENELNTRQLNSNKKHQDLMLVSVDALISEGITENF
jgi:hypothetical protein